MIRNIRFLKSKNKKDLAKILSQKVFCAFISPLERLARPLAARLRLFAAFYYFLVNNGFSYEQRAFVYGKQMYAKSLVTPNVSMAILRRNVHRIEKGLLMRPLRVPFALDYIGETVTAFCTAVNSNNVDSTEVAWARDVLAEYFVMCENCEQISSMKERFQAVHIASCSSPDAKLIPYKRDPAELPPISIDEFISLAEFRRSVRWFLDKRVPREIIDKAILVGGLAPSACNRQPYEFRVIDDPELVKKVSRIPMGTSGYAQNITCLVVIVGKQRNYFDERDRHLIYIDGSLAAMSFIFALEIQGISSCCINWPEIANKDDLMADAIKLERDERPVMCIAIGYPDPEGMVARSTKKSLQVIRRYNFE